MPTSTAFSWGVFVFFFLALSDLETFFLFFVCEGPASLISECASSALVSNRDGDDGDGDGDGD